MNDDGRSTATDTAPGTIAELIIGADFSRGPIPAELLMDNPTSPDDVTQLLDGQGYVADTALATTVFLAVRLGRPILAEGPPGTGKTDLARAIAAGLGRRLLRLQCHEELDERRALYDWSSARQLLALQLLRSRVDQRVSEASSWSEALAETAGVDALLFSEDFLVERPLLGAIRSPDPVVLLIDEVDRSTEAFEALLLEVLGEDQVSIPELGTVLRRSTPLVILTSNATRELSDALRRRCLHLEFTYPSRARELEILRRHVPGIETTLATAVVEALSRLRSSPAIARPPGVSEAVDWARCLEALAANRLDAAVLAATLGSVVKASDDRRAALSILSSPRTAADGSGDSGTTARRGPPASSSAADSFTGRSAAEQWAANRQGANGDSQR